MQLGLGLGLQRRIRTLPKYQIIDILGGKENSPLLVDSNALLIAVDDTIEFGDLSAYSLVSSQGTAVVEISGNTILCTGTGTLYNLILNDGVENHIYPLAEGGYTIAYDTNETPQHGTIVAASLLWTLQDEYHKNVEGHNVRDGLDFVTFDNLIDSNEDGIADGWVNTFTGSIHTVVDGVQRVTTPPEGLANFYRFSIFKNNVFTVGVEFALTIRIRGNESLTLQIRFGATLVNVTNGIGTEWADVTVIGTPTSNGNLGIVAVNLDGDKWFEFDYVNIEEYTGVNRSVPKRESSLLDCEGNTIDVIGDGYFIDCETNLLFPDIPLYQTIDDHLEFFYDRYGDQRKLSWDELIDNPFGFERVFINKVGGKINPMIVTIPTNFSRSAFISFLGTLGRAEGYVYQPITKGCIIFFNYSLYTEPAEADLIYTAINDRGALSEARLPTPFDEATYISGGDAIKEYLIGGTTSAQKLVSTSGNTSFDLFDAAEETSYSEEIVSGDLIVIDTYDAKRGAYVKIDFPDFITEGTLINITKTSGTSGIDMPASPPSYQYGGIVWIPSGQSGVPTEFEEIPLSYNSADGELYLRKWNAADQFSVSFTNNDAINMYILTDTEYKSFISVIGMKCYYKHQRLEYDRWDADLRLMASLEGHPGELVGDEVASKALWDADMLFGSSGGRLHDTKNKPIIFDNQNNPREWCGMFGHADPEYASQIDLLDNQLPLIAANNDIYSLDQFRLFITDFASWKAVADKCDELGILFCSPLDFIKNLQFNDYDVNDFWK